MATQKRQPADDSALQSFYEAFGLDPKTIERAIKLRYSEPPRAFPRQSDFAKSVRREAVAPKMRAPK
jgi:hypothetical protein